MRYLKPARCRSRRRANSGLVPWTAWPDIRLRTCSERGCGRSISADAEEQGHGAGDLMSQIGGHRVSDLVVLLGARPNEDVVIGESLQTCCFTNGEATHLQWIRMDEVVPVLGDVRHDGVARGIVLLNPEAVHKGSRLVVDVLVIGHEYGRKFTDSGTPSILVHP